MSPSTSRSRGVSSSSLVWLGGWGASAVGRNRPGSLNVYRTGKVPATQAGGLAVRAADWSLLATLGARIIRGSFLTPATARYPAVVLGYQVASTLGIAEPGQARPGGSVADGFTSSACLARSRSPPKLTAPR